MTDLAPPKSRDYLRSIDVVTWPEFLSRFRWEQGEHVTLIGPTGSGKTILARELLELRRTVVAVFTKRRDPSLDRFREYGYRVCRSLPLPPWEIEPRVAFWPPSERMTDAPRQKQAIMELLANQYRQGGDAIYIDELWRVCKVLKLEPLVELFWRESRAQGNSLVASAQRPAHVPLVAYSQARHLFFWTNADDVDVKRVAGMAGQNRTIVARLVSQLGENEFLYVNTATHDRAVSRVDLGALR